MRRYFLIGIAIDGGFKELTIIAEGGIFPSRDSLREAVGAHKSIDFAVISVTELNKKGF